MQYILFATLFGFFIFYADSLFSPNNSFNERECIFFKTFCSYLCFHGNTSISSKKHFCNVVNSTILMGVCNLYLPQDNYHFFISQASNFSLKNSFISTKTRKSAPFCIEGNTQFTNVSIIQTHFCDLSLTSLISSQHHFRSLQILQFTFSNQKISHQLPFFIAGSWGSYLTISESSFQNITISSASESLQNHFSSDNANLISNIFEKTSSICRFCGDYSEHSGHIIHYSSFNNSYVRCSAIQTNYTKQTILTNESEFTFKLDEFLSCSAKSGNEGNDPSSCGGGIFISNCLKTSLYILDCKAEYCKSSFEGGFLYCNKILLLSIKNLSGSYCTTGISWLTGNDIFSGGAIFAIDVSQSFLIEGCSFRECESALCGGAIYFESTMTSQQMKAITSSPSLLPTTADTNSLIIPTYSDKIVETLVFNCSFINCHCMISLNSVGGGIYYDVPDMRAQCGISECFFFGCKSRYSGGIGASTANIALTDEEHILFNYCLFEDNLRVDGIFISVHDVMISDENNILNKSSIIFANSFTTHKTHSTIIVRVKGVCVGIDCQGMNMIDTIYVDTKSEYDGKLCGLNQSKPCKKISEALDLNYPENHFQLFAYGGYYSTETLPLQCDRNTMKMIGERKDVSITTYSLPQPTFEIEALLVVSALDFHFINWTILYGYQKSPSNDFPIFNIYNQSVVQLNNVTVAPTHEGTYSRSVFSGETRFLDLQGVEIENLIFSDASVFSTSFYPEMLTCNKSIFCQLSSTSVDPVVANFPTPNEKNGIFILFSETNFSSLQSSNSESGGVLKFHFGNSCYYSITTSTFETCEICKMPELGNADGNSFGGAMYFDGSNLSPNNKLPFFFQIINFIDNYAEIGHDCYVFCNNCTSQLSESQFQLSRKMFSNTDNSFMAKDKSEFVIDVIKNYIWYRASIIYVNKSSSTSTNCGSDKNPCSTLSLGISHLEPTERSTLIVQTTSSIEQVCNVYDTTIISSDVINCHEVLMNVKIQPNFKCDGVIICNKNVSFTGFSFVFTEKFDFSEKCFFFIQQGELTVVTCQFSTRTDDLHFESSPHFGRHSDSAESQTLNTNTRLSVADGITGCSSSNEREDNIIFNPVFLKITLFYSNRGTLSLRNISFFDCSFMGKVINIINNNAISMQKISLRNVSIINGLLLNVNFTSSENIEPISIGEISLQTCDLTNSNIITIVNDVLENNLPSDKGSISLYSINVKDVSAISTTYLIFINAPSFFVNFDSCNFNTLLIDHEFTKTLCAIQLKNTDANFSRCSFSDFLTDETALDHFNKESEQIESKNFSNNDQAFLMFDKDSSLCSWNGGALKIQESNAEFNYCNFSHLEIGAMDIQKGFIIIRQSIFEENKPSSHSFPSFRKNIRCNEGSIQIDSLLTGDGSQPHIPLWLLCKENCTAKGAVISERTNWLFEPSLSGATWEKVDGKCQLSLKGKLLLPCDIFFQIITFVNKERKTYSHELEANEENNSQSCNETDYFTYFPCDAFDSMDKDSNASVCILFKNTHTKRYVETNSILLMSSEPHNNDIDHLKKIILPILIGAFSGVTIVIVTIIVFIKVKRRKSKAISNKSHLNSKKSSEPTENSPLIPDFIPSPSLNTPGLSPLSFSINSDNFFSYKVGSPTLSQNSLSSSGQDTNKKIIEDAFVQPNSNLSPLELAARARSHQFSSFHQGAFPDEYRLYLIPFDTQAPFLEE